MNDRQFHNRVTELLKQGLPLDKAIEIASNEAKGEE